MKKNGRETDRLICILGAIILLAGAGLYAQESTPALIRTGMIHKFAQYVEWENEQMIDTFRIGVFGEDPELMSTLRLLESVSLKGKPVSIVQFTRFGEITPTQILYLTRDRNIEFQRTVNRIAGNNTLLVSDRARNQELIMLNLLPMEGGKAGFEMDTDNIMKANLNIKPELLMEGGSDLDLVGLYQESQDALNESTRQLSALSDSLQKQNLQIETQKSEIENRNREIEVQKALFEQQQSQLNMQQVAMDEYAARLEEMSAEVQMKQDTLNSRMELISIQEEEITTQRQEIESRNTILEELEKSIASREIKINEQTSQLSSLSRVIARQKTYLFINITVIFLVIGLIFFIYRSYRIKKNANHEIEEKNRELENQKTELQFTLENLKLTQSQLIQSEKMASVGVLTAGIAHELNNPINFVRGNVNPLQRDVNDLFALIKMYDEIIGSKKLNDEFREAEELKTKLDYSYLTKEIVSLLEGIEEGAMRSSQIVKGLRSFSRLDEEKVQVYDIHEGIDSSLILLHNKLKNRITIRKDYGDFDMIECYPGKLNQVFMNILTNSIQAIEGEGEIDIQSVGSHIGIKIIIKDSGRGMSPEVQEHIFEPFFTTKEVGKGTGLGLSISFGIIEQHNGNIDVISEPGKGSEFIISLPKKQIN